MSEFPNHLGFRYELLLMEYSGERIEIPTSLHTYISMTT